MSQEKVQSQPSSAIEGVAVGLIRLKTLLQWCAKLTLAFGLSGEDLGGCCWVVGISINSSQTLLFLEMGDPWRLWVEEA